MLNKPLSPSETQSPISNLQSLISDPFLWLTLLLTLPVIGPLLQPGYLWGAHDARHSVYFLFEFNQALQDGILYPRWAPNFAFGFGYPFFNIYGPLSSYAGALFLLGGADYVTAVKIVLGLSAVLSGLTMYLFARALFNRPAGLIAALLYVYLPYHLFDLYVRAALAESVAFVFVPLVMWAFYRAATRPTLGNVIWGAMAYAGLFFTHNSLGLLFVPVMGLYVLVLLLFTAPYPPGWKERLLTFIKRGLPSAALLALALGLSAIFLLPAILETQFVRVDQWTAGRYAFGSDFVEFFQLFSPRWGFGASIPGPDDETGFQLGLAAVVLFIISFVKPPSPQPSPKGRGSKASPPEGENKGGQKVSLRFMQGLTIVIAFLSLSISAPVWQILSPLQMAQFPWRLIFLLAPAIAVAGGSIGLQFGVQSSEFGVRSSEFRVQSSEFRVQSSELDTEDSQFAHSPIRLFALVLPLALLIMLSSFPYVQAEIREPLPTEGPVSLAGLFRFQQASDELTGSTIWVKEIPTWSPLADTVIAGEEIESRVLQTEVWSADGQTPLMGVNSFEQDSVHEFVWVFTADDEQSITFYIPYYPGWTATLYEDSAPERPDLYPYGRIGPAIAELDIETTDPEGWMTINLPAGNHFLELRFKDTPVRVVGKWLSLASLALCVVGLGYYYMNPRRTRRTQNELSANRRE